MLEYLKAYIDRKRLSKEIHQFGRITKRETSFVTNSSLVLLDSRHNIDRDSTRIIDREPEYFPRKVREAIHIRRQRPEINKDGGLEPRVLNCLTFTIDHVFIAAPPTGRDANSQSEQSGRKSHNKENQTYARRTKHKPAYLKTLILLPKLHSVQLPPPQCLQE